MRFVARFKSSLTKNAASQQRKLLIISSVSWEKKCTKIFMDLWKQAPFLRTSVNASGIFAFRRKLWLCCDMKSNTNGIEAAFLKVYE